MIHLIVFTVAMAVTRVSGHGYLLVPPARNTAWRTDPENWEPNYTDTQLNCGGFANQWEQQGGKCGVCGDPYQGPYEHEAGGVFAKLHRKVTRCYNRADDVIDIHVVITAHHKGYFEFRLCQHNNMTERVQESCFENGILMSEYGTGITRFDINTNVQWDYFYQLNMPRNVNCTQCILRWEYTAGNRWGCDDTGCAIGLGNQEWFINCADVAILDDCATMTSPAPTRSPGPSQCGRRRLRR